MWPSVVYQKHLTANPPVVASISIWGNELFLISHISNKIWGQTWCSGTKCDCKTDWLWVRSPLEEMKYLLKFIFSFLRLVSRQSATFISTTQNSMPPEFDRKWGTKCLNTRFPLPTLLCSGYSVKLIW